MAADPDPYFALPKLYGGPAYARPRTPVPAAERPFDPDDLPIVAAMTQDERVVVAALAPSGLYPSIGYALPAVAAAGSHREMIGRGGATGVAGAGARRLSLRALTDRLGPRPK